MKRILAFFITIMLIFTATYYYLHDIVRIEPVNKNTQTTSFDERYVMQIDGGKIVKVEGSGTLLNDYTLLANFTEDNKTLGLSVKPNQRNGKVSWIMLKPVGSGKYYQGRASGFPFTI